MARTLTTEQLSSLLDDDSINTIKQAFGDDDDDYVGSIKDTVQDGFPLYFHGAKFGNVQIHPVTGDLLYARGENITPAKLKKIMDSGIENMYITNRPEFIYDLPADSPLREDPLFSDKNAYDDELTDYILSNYAGELPGDNASDEEWKEFYAEGSPFSKWEDAMRTKYKNPYSDKTEVDSTGTIDDDELTDYILSNYAGELPGDNASDEEWKEFYAEGSPFRKWEDAMRTKYKNPYSDKTEVDSTGTIDNGKTDTPKVSDENQKDKKKRCADPGCSDKRQQGKLIYDEDQDKGLIALLKKASPARNKGTVSDARQKNILTALMDARF